MIVIGLIVLIVISRNMDSDSLKRREYIRRIEKIRPIKHRESTRARGLQIRASMRQQQKGTSRKKKQKERIELDLDFDAEVKFYILIQKSVNV